MASSSKSSSTSKKVVTKATSKPAAAKTTCSKTNNTPTKACKPACNQQTEVKTTISIPEEENPLKIDSNDKVYQALQILLQCKNELESIRKNTTPASKMEVIPEDIVESKSKDESEILKALDINTNLINKVLDMQHNLLKIVADLDDSLSGLIDKLDDAFFNSYEN